MVRREQAASWLTRDGLSAAVRRLPKPVQLFLGFCVAVARWAREPVLVFACVYMVAAAVAQPFYVPSGSMQPTLGIGDLLLATKFSYGYNR